MTAIFRPLAVAGVAVAAACSAGPTDVATLTRPAVLAVTPSPGALGVDPRGPVTVTFSHAMMAGVQLLVVLHEGTVAGPVVPSVASWSPDRRSLTLTPSAPLKTKTTYVIHLAPTLRSADGIPLDHATCAALGGRQVTSGMMGGGGMTGGSMGPGMMGSGWQPANDSYGMVFTFTTA